MNALDKISESDRYARCIYTSKRVRWDLDEDVIRGRTFDVTHKFLPDGLSLAEAFTTLSADEKRFVSQIQGRTYANVFGLVERFINAKVLELSRDHWFGDQVALEALVRFSDEELKHQALFRRIDMMVSDVLPDGYHFDVDPDAVGRRARQEYVGGAGTDIGYRAVHTTPLSTEHQSRSRSIRTVQGCISLSLEGGVPARDPRRTRVDTPRRRDNPRETRPRG
jgi:hypothetical protein